MNNETIIAFSFISMPDSEVDIRGGRRGAVIQSLSFPCLFSAYPEKTLRESSKIFVEHALHAARVQFRTQA